MKITKITRKITKLLALTGSSNKFEAERARVQANALIKKYNINAIDTETANIHTNTAIRRKNLNQSEQNLIGGITSTTKTIAWISVTGEGLKPCFAGINDDALFAAYAFDCLYNQLNKKLDEVKEQFDEEQIELFANAWVNGISYKLFELFSFNRINSAVAERIRQKNGIAPPNKTNRPAERNKPRTPEESNIIFQGSQAGKKAKLFKPVKSA